MDTNGLVLASQRIAWAKAACRTFNRVTVAEYAAELTEVERAALTRRIPHFERAADGAEEVLDVQEMLEWFAAQRRSS